MKKSLAVLAFLTVPALAVAQAGLSRIQFLALQQELRDQGCGVTNVDGHYGPQTRRAIATCAKKFNSANNASALLAAMNIGFGPSDNPPTGTGATGSADMSSGSTMSAGTTDTGSASATPVSGTRRSSAAARRRRAARAAAAAADTTKH